MKITILTVGENKFPYLKSGEKLYIERLSHYTDLTLRSLALSRKMKNGSPEHQIQMWHNRSVSKLAFCIGGPFGLDSEFIRQSDFVLSLSSMTFPHDMVRLFFLEQLYRAFTILNGEKYHK
jgi:23S rRNA (pseudouridine1915-N3)-methyltransferase